MRAGAGEHPDENATAAYLDGTLPAAEREAFETHVADCDPCRAGIALLAPARTQDAGPVPADWIERARGRARTPRVHPRARFAAFAALAAAGILLAAGASYYLLLAPTSIPSAPVERDGQGSELRALAPPGGAIVPAHDLAFAWSPLTGADRYIVMVTDAEGAPVGSFESRSAGEPRPWPAGRAQLAPGAYLWSVRAMALDRVVAQTRPLPFEIR